MDTIIKDLRYCHGRHIKHIEALYAISQALSNLAAQDERLVSALGIIENKLEMERATLLLLSADGEELVFEVASGIPKGTAGNISYRRGEGITGRVLQTGNSEIIPCISEEPEFRNRIHKRPGVDNMEWSFICVPVSIGNEVIGALSVDIEFAKDRELHEDERILTVVASLIAHDVRTHRQSILQRKALEEENRRLRSQLDDSLRPDNIVGSSDRMRAVYQKIHQVAESDATVMIRGESGTGKELVATALHYNSHRADKPFIKVNCAALSESLLESELFGHEKGAFTGALQKRIGRIEESEGGTLFLDEIGDFSPAIQVKMLRVLQEREYTRVGSNEERKANIRFVVATNRDLEDLVQKELFRQDLYYRINVFPIFLPPLRERREDILNLANHFVERYAKKMGKEIHRISTTAINMMMAYHWPGNVRELENCMEHAVLLCPGEAIQGSHLPPTLGMPKADEDAVAGSFTSRVSQLEKDMIMDALKRCKGNVSAAARELGITSRMVRYKIEKLEIDYDSVFSGKKK
ncbi:MAG: sigma 54-interacting transcriptional regulator [Deltaproteobacteria bacterium]|nr:sigma 54-interacting transcriptional regulator [Deltaproteobacteria bacterium]